MADDAHVAILKKGVEAWNAWRNESRDSQPAQFRTDLVGMNQAKADLSGADLRQVNLSGANLSGTYLSGNIYLGPDLRGDYLRRTTLRLAEETTMDLSRADLRGVDLSETDLRGADLRKAYLIEANLGGVDLREANLTEANLFLADLSMASLIRTNLTGASLSLANLTGASLIMADLTGADLTGANLGEANLTRANLTGADLSEAYLDITDLSEANLSGANLVGVDLSGVNLNGADLSKADLTNAHLQDTVLTNTNLTEVKGLETCHHYGPSSVDHRTLLRSGPLPLVFLRGVGLPDTLIDYLPSLLNQPIQFYSCFISYSSKDQEFAERLHADLQNKGVRCWFAPHDLPIGAKTWDAIDEAIRLRDKVLLILSENAIASDWVEDEVSKAYAEERDRKQVMLFPVRLDNTVMQTGEAWARKLRDQRNIGNFINWKDHDSYQKSLERVLRDLKLAQEPTVKTVP